MRRIIALCAATLLLSTIVGCAPIKNDGQATLLKGDTPSTSEAFVEVPQIEEFDLPVEEQSLVVHFMDVGNGDAILLQADEQTMLIDGGGKETAGDVVKFLEKQGVEKLDYMVATHPHESHVAGLIKVLSKYEVGEVLLPNFESNDSSYTKLIKTVKKQGIASMEVKAGNSFNIGTSEVAILSAASGPDEHNASLVFKVTCGNTSFLFTGDAEVATEQTMLATATDLSATVLKVGNHGNKGASFYQFLKSVNPKHAIISSATPARESILNSFAEIGTDVYSTSKDGVITVISDGTTVSVSSQKGE